MKDFTQATKTVNDTPVAGLFDDSQGYIRGYRLTGGMWFPVTWGKEDGVAVNGMTLYNLDGTELPEIP